MAKPKTLVVFYSRTGTTRRIAEALTRALGCDQDEIVEATSRLGLSGYWRSVSEARRRLPAATAAAKRDPSDYDLVIIGTPVWAWSLSSPVRAYLTLNAPRLREVAFFATMGGTGAKTAFAQMQALAGKPPRATLALTARETKPGRYEAKLDAFVKALQASVGKRPPARAKAAA